MTTDDIVRIEGWSRLSAASGRWTASTSTYAEARFRVPGAQRRREVHHDTDPVGPDAP